MRSLLTIIVTYNGMKWIADCISSVRNSTFRSDILIIDNCSSDGTLDWISGHMEDDIILRPQKENLGFAKANNIGLKYALERGYEYIYLLNQDAWVFPETFQRLIQDLKSDPSIGIISPMQMTADLLKMDTQFEKQCKKYLDSTFNIVEVPFVMAAHWMMARASVEKIGGFSPAFPHYGEDDNLTDRAHYFNLSVCIDKKVIAVHDRDSRPRPKKYRMMLKKIHARKMICNPCSNPLNSAVKTPLWLVGMGVYHLSAGLILEAFLIITRYPYLYRIRKQSISGTTPFLG